MALKTSWRLVSLVLLLVFSFSVSAIHALSNVAAQPHGGTPAQSYTCRSATPPGPTPAMNHGGMTDMTMGTPMAEMGEMDMMMEFDQLYIDMMLAHHGSIIALAETALSELTDPRLQEIARTISDTQTAEQQELREYRDTFYGSPDPAPIDAHMMEMMMQAMPGMGSMAAMDTQMSATTQITAFCAAENFDLAFIDLTIPHHEMAVTASGTALTEAVHPEIVAFAQRVIEDQQREIDELTAIRVELTGEATPAG